VHGLASHFVWTTRSKESITRDVKQPNAVEAVHALLTDADVYTVYHAIDRQTPPKPTSASIATICPRSPFKAGDGKTVMLGLQNERKWTSFCTMVVQQSDLAGDVRLRSNSRRVERLTILGQFL
jgi:crotonobetainyl-CoA:carnitine CoA-transferase CaiB-like acyl-CoA transferase